MDAVSYSLASKQAQRIEKFIENPDSTSGIVTVPKTIASGETVTIPAGRVAVLPNVQVDGTLNINGEVFVPSGATFGDLEDQLALKAPLSSPAFTGTPTAPTQTAGNNSTRIATTAYVDGKMVLATAATASGTAIDFTNIPSWVKRITVMFNGVSTNGTSPVQIQLGDSGGIENSGYVSTTSTMGASLSSSTSGLLVGGISSSSSRNGIANICKINENSFVMNSLVSSENSQLNVGGGSKTLSATLDRIRVTTINGTDQFDAGQINILYEG